MPTIEVDGTRLELNEEGFLLHPEQWNEDLARVLAKTNRQVRVLRDTRPEADETFFLDLTQASNAVLADSQGVCTILNDDVIPGLNIESASVAEGNSGTTNAVFTVGLSAASGQSVTVDYATANGTATAGSDYVAASGRLVPRLRASRAASSFPCERRRRSGAHPGIRRTLPARRKHHRVEGRDADRVQPVRWLDGQGRVAAHLHLRLGRGARARAGRRDRDCAAYRGAVERGRAAAVATRAHGSPRGLRVGAPRRRRRSDHQGSRRRGSPGQ